MWALAGTHIYVSLHNIGSYTTVSMIWYMYTSEYIDVYKKNQSVSTHKGTNICEFAQLGLIHKRIYNMIHVYLWILVNTCEYLWLLVNTCEYVWILVNTCENMWILVNTCEHLWIYVCIQRGSKCECVRGQEHMPYNKFCVEIIQYVYIYIGF